MPIASVADFCGFKRRGHEAIPERIVNDTIHEWKRRKYELCDAAIRLHAGFYNCLQLLSDEGFLYGDLKNSLPY